MLKSALRLGLGAAALGLLAAPMQAVTVNAGIDLWHTANGAAVSFAEDPIPAGTFCNSSSPYYGSISTKGKPVKSNKNLGNADTVLWRTEAVDLPYIGSSGTTPLQIIALSMVGKSNFTAYQDECGKVFSVKVRLDPGDNQNQSEMTLFHSHPYGGTFNATVDVQGEVIFTETTTGEVIYAQSDIKMDTVAAPWDLAAGAGGITVAGRNNVDIDTDCDGVIDDTNLPGTSNFAAGWEPSDAGPGQGQQVLVNHTGPHPTDPPKPSKCRPIGIEIEIEPVELGPMQEGEQRGTVVMKNGRLQIIGIDIQPIPCEDIQIIQL